jgi:capsular polysaccharide biosynthesis protein
LQDRFIFTEENHFFAENFFYAGLAGMSGCINPWKVAFLRDHLGKMSAGQLGQGENVYIIRRGKTRGLRNEQEVEAFFRRRGWSVIDTEQLTVAQQAGIFAQAKKICTLHGAALTNLIWASPGTQVLELLADNFLNGVYEGLAKVLGLDYSFRIYRGDSRCRIHVLEEDLMAWLEKPA